jgi:Cu(I)/Ag(I) efflux system membrane protein CusA/SilA
VEGRERYPISVRYPQHWRDSPEQLRRLPIVTSNGLQIALGDVARIKVIEGPEQIRSEDARPVGWIHVSVQPGQLRSYVVEARRQVEANVSLPPGYSIRWAGQYEYFERALDRLSWSSTLVMLVTFGLLWLAFRRYTDALIVLGLLPVALVGAVWMLWLLGYNMSVGVAVGMIALCGVAAETGIVMLLYLNSAWSARTAVASPNRADLLEAITEGALARLRPKLMTVTAITMSLLPVMFGYGAGSEVMRRIAAPIIGGMISATALTLLLVPALFLLVRGRGLANRDAST